MRRLERLTGGPADLLRPSLGDRVVSTLLTVTAGSSFLIVTFALVATSVLVWAPVSLGLLQVVGFDPGSRPLPWLLGMALAVESAFLACSVPLVLDALRHGERIVLDHAQATRHSPGQLRRLRNVAEEVALAAGIPAPEVVLVGRIGPNAMTVGSADRPTLAASPDLLDLLNRQQLQAVIAHEIAHVVNGDLRSGTLLAAVYIRYEALVGWARNETTVAREAMGWTGLLVWLSRPPLHLGQWFARLTGLGAARHREFLADRTAAWLTRDPQSLVDALKALSEAGAVDSGPAEDLAHLCIVDALSTDASTSRWMASHPPLSERVERLRAIDAALAESCRQQTDLPGDASA